VTLVELVMMWVGVTVVELVMMWVEYKLYVSGAGSPVLRWIVCLLQVVVSESGVLGTHGWLAHLC